MEDILFKIDGRILKEAADQVTYQGEKYRLGAMTASGSRELIGPNGIAGAYYPETGQITVSGSGFDDDETTFKGPPRQSGWEIVWEAPNPEKLAGGGKTGVFFPKEKDFDYKTCPVCGGKKKEPGSRITPEQAKEQGVLANPKGKLCTNCYGFGILNPRVDAYFTSLRRQGRAPKVKIARGISRYPTVGTEI